MTEFFVYDKAKYHFQGDWPEDLPETQSFVHTGMFLGWLVENELVSEDFAEDFAEEIFAFQERQLTGPELFQVCDGVLTSDMLSDEGNRFARTYLDYETGAFLADYEKVFGDDLPSLYHVADTWENFFALAAVINTRFQEKFSRQ